MRSQGTASRSAVLDELPAPRQLATIAVAVASEAASLVRSRARDWNPPPTKSSPTDIVTQTDIESEELIRARLSVATPTAGFVGEEGGSTLPQRRLQWVVDPLDGTVNFWYGLPVVAVSIAAAIDGVVSAAAVVDVERGETFSAAIGSGAQAGGVAISASSCTELGQALVTTGFSYHAETRAAQGAVVSRLLPHVRDVRCFGSAALQMCWVACGRTDSYFERDTKVWDYSAASLVAQEGGAVVELPCPENDGLAIASAPAVFEQLRRLVAVSH
jgi:myo-inositol-1(or 4)-monophosphatase